MISFIPGKPHQTVSGAPVFGAKSFSPTRSRMATDLLTAKPAGVLDALNEPSGFAGLTLGEGMQHYYQLSKRKADDYLLVAASPFFIAAFTCLETMCLPMWLFKKEREWFLREQDEKYPYGTLKDVTLETKRVVFNRLILSDDLYQRMGQLTSGENSPHNTRQAFDKMVSRWVDLGLVAKKTCFKIEHLMITRKGFRTLKQYAKTHPKTGAPA